MRQILRKGEKAAKNILCLDDSCTPDPVLSIASHEGSSSTPCIKDATLVVKEHADPQQALQHAEAAAEGMTSPAGRAQYLATAAEDRPEDLDTADNVQDKYLRPLKIFDAVIGEIANVNPYVKMALGVLFCASKIILAQADRDKAVLELFGKLAQVFLFMTEDKNFRFSLKPASLGQISQQTLEYAHFSTPHLYVSALPFSPTNSALSGTFSARFPNTLCVSSGRDMNWLAVLAMLRGHDGPVNSVSFSPNGTRIITGSFDSTVRLWGAATGRPVGEPLKGHTSSVNSVSFPLDGTRIVTGSDDSTVRPWDVPTRELLQQCAEFAVSPEAVSRLPLDIAASEHLRVGTRRCLKSW